MHPNNPASKKRQVPAPSAGMSKGEREKLFRLVRQREKVLKSGDRHADAGAEFRRSSRQGRAAGHRATGQPECTAAPLPGASPPSVT